MRIGVISDTHDNLANVERIVALLNAARVEHVVHTGDITQPKTLAVLARLDAPLVGVFGNNDLERPRLEHAARHHGMDLEGGQRRFDWAGRGVVLLHDPAEIDLPEDARVVLHGHTHRHVHESRHGRLWFNPGECAGHLPGHNRVGVLDLASLDVELLRF